MYLFNCVSMNWYVYDCKLYLHANIYIDFTVNACAESLITGT